MEIDTRMRLAAVALISTVVGALLALAILPDARTAIRGIWHRDDTNARLTGIAHVGGPFALTTHTGAGVTNEDFRGRFMLIVFGYVAAPEVTPASLQAITDALARLGPTARKFQPLFITLDPERDSPPKLAKFIARFDPRFLALTGTRAEIDRVATAYFVHPSRRASASAAGGYVIDYTALIYVMDPRGRYAAHFSFTTPVADIVERLRALSR